MNRRKLESIRYLENLYTTVQQCLILPQYDMMGNIHRHAKDKGLTTSLRSKNHMIRSSVKTDLRGENWQATN